MNADGFAKHSPSQRPMLSVIIPACNAAHVLGEQLEALKAQEYDGDWEIVVVNNCSTDGTADLVQDYQRLMPNLYLVHALARQNASYYARNVGVQAARGEALLFCDADDVVAPGWLRALAEAFEKHDLVAGAVKVDTLNQSAPWRPLGLNVERPVLDFLPFINGCHLSVSREAFEAVGGFSEEFSSSGDADFTWRLQLHGYAIHYAPAAVVHYRYRETLWELWKQFSRYGRGHPLLYQHFASHGMPRSSTREALREYKRLIRKALRICIRGAEQQERARWVYKVAMRWGRLWSSIRYRTLYL